MRITFLTHFPGNGGSTSMLCQLMDFFRSRGHVLSVVVGEDCERPVIKDYVVVPVKPGTPWRNRIRSYKETVDATKPDLIYSISGRDEFDVHRFLPYARVRHIFSLERHEYVDVPFWLRQLNGFSEAITANTPDVLEQISSYGCLECPGIVAPYKISSAFLSIAPRPMPVAGNAEREINVCFVGRLETFQKQAHWLPEIISGCKSAGRKLRWHIYGEGPAEGAIRKELLQRNCAEVVQFYGWLDAASLARHLAEHDLFFLCSRWEGLPISMVEGMLCGLACVVPSIPAGITHVLEKGGGWTYQANSPADSVQALLRATAVPEAILKAKVEARSVASSLFNETVVTEQLMELERTLLGLRYNGHVVEIGRARRMRCVSHAVYAKRVVLKLARHLGIYKQH